MEEEGRRKVMAFEARICDYGGPAFDIDTTKRTRIGFPLMACCGRWVQDY